MLAVVAECRMARAELFGLFGDKVVRESTPGDEEEDLQCCLRRHGNRTATRASKSVVAKF